MGKSKRNNPLVSVVALVFTTGISVGGVLGLISILWLNRMGFISSGQNQTTQLTLLGDTFSGYSTFRSQAFQEALKEVGISLRYADEFDQAKRADLLNQGNADLLVTTLDQFLKQKPQGKIVGLIDRTVGADAVVLNTKKYPSLKSLLDLNNLVQQRTGQKLGITFAGDTPSEYLTLVLSTKFEAFNLSDFEVKKVADASNAWKLLQDPTQNLAVAVIWEPYVSQARQQGYTVVLSSKDAPEAIVDVIVASDRLIQSQPDKISQLLAAYYRRIDANIREASQLQKQIAEDGKLSPSDANAVLQGIDFFTAVEAKNWLTNDTLKKRIIYTAAILTMAGELDKVPQPDALFSSQFISQAAANTQTLISLIRPDKPQLADRLAGNGKVIAPTTVNISQIKTAPNIGNLQVRGEVKFNVGSTQLNPQSKQTLNQLAQEIAEFNPQTVAVKVIGHTSKTGTANFNQIMSQQRAQVVASYLRSRRLKHKIVAEGKSFSKPLPGISPTDYRNQRTEVRLVRVN